jgi:SAM-dependent methyltransferase
VRPDPAAPLPDVEPRDATIKAFDELGLGYERAFRDLPALDTALERLLGALPTSSRVLDVESGTGRPMAERLATAGHRVVGIDVSPVMVDIARDQVPQASFEPADVRTYPSPARSWAAVCAVFSLLTIPRPELDATLARLAAWCGRRRARHRVPGTGGARFSHPADVILEKVRGSGLQIDRHDLSTFSPDVLGAPPEDNLFVEARAPVG